VPEVLAAARFVDGICQRYSVLPSQLEHEDLALIRMLGVLSDAGDLGGKSEPVAEQNEPDSPLADLMETIA
jgi:hypothetical protein